MKNTPKINLKGETHKCPLIARKSKIAPPNTII